jgi:hypothetical protein
MCGGFRLLGVAADNPARVLISFGRRKRPAGLFTIKEVAEACQLPQPAVAQLARRTWTDNGWMYTAEQLHSAVEIGRRVLDRSYWSAAGGNVAPEGRIGLAHDGPAVITWAAGDEGQR